MLPMIKGMDITKIKGIDINSCIIDDFSFFDCGNKGLNDYLTNKAFQDSILGVNNTTVFFNKDDKVVGYYSLQTSLFEVRESLDSDKLKDDFPEAGEYLSKLVQLPSIHVNNFAVDKNFQKQGFGTKMMFKLFYSLYLMRASTNIAVSLLTLESTEEAEEFYMEGFGFEYAHKNYDVSDPIGNKYPYSMMLRFSSIIEAIEEMDVPIPNNPFNFLSELN